MAAKVNHEYISVCWDASVQLRFIPPHQSSKNSSHYLHKSKTHRPTTNNVAFTYSIIRSFHLLILICHVYCCIFSFRPLCVLCWRANFPPGSIKMLSVSHPGQCYFSVTFNWFHHLSQQHSGRSTCVQCARASTCALQWQAPFTRMFTPWVKKTTDWKTVFMFPILPLGTETSRQSLLITDSFFSFFFWGGGRHKGNR